MTMPSLNASTYADYWTALFGERDAEQVVWEFELALDGLDEWVGTNEAEAERQGLTLVDEWSARVRAELREAIAAATELARVT